VRNTKSSYNEMEHLKCFGSPSANRLMCSLYNKCKHLYEDLLTLIGDLDREAPFDGDLERDKRSDFLGDLERSGLEGDLERIDFEGDPERGACNPDVAVERFERADAFDGDADRPVDAGMSSSFSKSVTFVRAVSAT